VRASAHGLPDGVVVGVEPDQRRNVLERGEVDGDRVLIGDGEVEIKTIAGKWRTADLIMCV